MDTSQNGQFFLRQLHLHHMADFHMHEGRGLTQEGLTFVFTNATQTLLLPAEGLLYCLTLLSAGLQHV